MHSKLDFCPRPAKKVRAYCPNICTVDALNPGQDYPSLGSSAQPKYFKKRF